MSTIPVRGCRDILCATATRRRALVDAFASLCTTHAFQEIETPLLERMSIYNSCGESSDVVAKQLFQVADCDPKVVLRPEGTAGVMRALSDLGLLKRKTAEGTKVWYAGPMFRRERPQKKRWRQFWQMGVEYVGVDRVGADAEVIEMASGFLKNIGLGGSVRVNTLGGREERRNYNEILKDWLDGRFNRLSEVSRERYKSGHCMRILDSELEDDLNALEGAPMLAEYISAEETERFEQLKALLDEANVHYTVDEKLVRGLDYYTSTAFEFDGDGGKAICAGGRYEGVVGGSGVGFAIGLDRIEVEEREEESGVEAYEKELTGGVAVIAAAKGADRVDNEVGQVCRKIARSLRASGIKAMTQLSGKRLPKAISKAVQHGAAVIAIVGEREVENGIVQLRFVNENGTGEEKLHEVEINRVAEIVNGSKSGIKAPTFGVY